MRAADPPLRVRCRGVYQRLRGDLQHAAQPRPVLVDVADALQEGGEGEGVSEVEGEAWGEGDGVARGRRFEPAASACR